MMTILILKQNKLRSGHVILQGGIDKYTAILNNILAAAIMEGATAEALESFVDYVENLKDIVNDMGEEAKGMCLAFLSEVDEADSYLY